MKTTYTALLDRLRRAGLVRTTSGSFNSDDTQDFIDHLALDSRKVGPRGLFIAIKGEAADGHLFIDKSVQNGAIAVVCEAVPEDAQTRFPGTAFVHVTDSRAALAELAAEYYGDPSHELELIGVTGTNGKTTTGFLLHHLLSTLGREAGLIGTVEVRVGSQRTPATLTTPDALELNRMLREMADAGCTACIMEVSSHALVQERVRALTYDVALFTNLTQDHLDYHPTFDDYLAAKKKLFDGLSASATALYNVDDAAGERMVEDTAAAHVGYGRGASANVRVEVLDNSLTGLHLRLDGAERRFRLVGLFNAYNLAAAYGAGRALGYHRDEVLDALATAAPVPGRFEQIRFEDGTSAIVDYAHTPDALENVLHTIRETRDDGAAIWCVFGCGGDRDPQKRPQMGAIAERLADHVIVTSDNPRTEDPPAILQDIRQGLQRPDDALWNPDRREAIREAVQRAAPGDVILVAGKGHEDYQILGTEKRHFDDREEVRAAFAARNVKAL